MSARARRATSPRPRSDLAARLAAERPVDRPLAMLRLALTLRRPPLGCPRTLAALEAALWIEFPPFAGDVYSELFQEAAASGQWLAMWLMKTAEDTGACARRLWALASGAERRAERRLLKQHAVDTSRHVDGYLELLDVVFPGALPAGFRAQLRQLSPGYSMTQKLRPGDRVAASSLGVDACMRALLAELRGTVRQLLLRPALAVHGSRARLPRVATLLDDMLRDGLRHIAERTARIEGDARGAGAEELRERFCRALREHVRSTSEELVDYTYNVRFGNYP